MKTHLATIVCKFGDDPSICLGEEVILTDKTDRHTDRQTDTDRWTDRQTDRWMPHDGI